MAEIAGKTGEVDSSGAEMAYDYVKNWAVSLVSDVLETTNFDVATSGRTYIPGLKGWSGSYECNYSTGNSSVAGDTQSLILRSQVGSTGGVFKGDVILTGMDITTPVDGIVTQSFTFQGTGALATSSG